MDVDERFGVHIVRNSATEAVTFAVVIDEFDRLP
jgi:hypothetical protein